MARTFKECLEETLHVSAEDMFAEMRSSLHPEVQAIARDIAEQDAEAGTIEKFSFPYKDGTRTVIDLFAKHFTSADGGEHVVRHLFPAAYDERAKNFILLLSRNGTRYFGSITFDPPGRVFVTVSERI